MRRWIKLVIIVVMSFPGVSASANVPLNNGKFKKLSDLNRRARFPFGVNAYGFGPIGGAAATVDYFITPKFAMEAGVGYRDWDFNHAFALGARYHFFGKTTLHLTPYIGIYTSFHYNGNDLQNHSLYIPVGLHKIKKNGITWSIECAWQGNTFFGNDFTGGFRIGYRFKTKRLIKKRS